MSASRPRRGQHLAWLPGLAAAGSLLLASPGALAEDITFGSKKLKRKHVVEYASVMSVDLDFTEVDRPDLPSVHVLLEEHHEARYRVRKYGASGPVLLEIDIGPWETRMSTDDTSDPAVEGLSPFEHGRYLASRNEQGEVVAQDEDKVPVLDEGVMGALHEAWRAFNQLGSFARDLPEETLQVGHEIDISEGSSFAGFASADFRVERGVVTLAGTAELDGTPVAQFTAELAGHSAPGAQEQMDIDLSGNVWVDPKTGLMREIQLEGTMVQISTEEGESPLRGEGPIRISQQARIRR